MTKSLPWLPGAMGGFGGGQEGKITQKLEGTFGDDDMFTILILMVISWMYVYVKMYQIVYLKSV